jgi:hypothetical protein
MKHGRIPLLLAAAAVTAALVSPASAGSAATVAGSSPLAVGPQYDTTHVYVAPGSMDAFVASWEATFGGKNTPQATVDVTPTPSETKSELVLSPVGTLSVFDFLTPVPYGFGAERTGWLMKDFDKGVRAARDSGATTVVAPFDDPIGEDVIVQFPGGVNAQLYWHTTPPHYDALATVPDNRIYLSPDAVGAFLPSYLRFTGGRVTRDERHADGAQIGKPGTTLRQIHLTSPFGNTLVLVTDGHLPYPFGRETTGYAVADLSATLAKATAAGATVLSGPNAGSGRHSAVARFPGGYVAEIHDGGTR